jgi:hypothetical protein
MSKHASDMPRSRPPVGRKRRTPRPARGAAAGSAATRAEQKHEAAVTLGALGGQARAQNLSAQRLTAIGRQGAAARWAKKGGSK